jgi:hypothetical protein
MRLPDTRSTIIVAAAIALISFLFVGVRRHDSLMAAITTGSIQISDLEVPYRVVLLLCIVVVASRMLYRGPTSPR